MGSFPDHSGESREVMRVRGVFRLPRVLSRLASLAIIDLFSLIVCFIFPIEVRGELDRLSFHKLRVGMHVNKTKIWEKQFSTALSHELYWENKTYKLKRAIREFTRRLKRKQMRIHFILTCKILSKFLLQFERSIVRLLCLFFRQPFI